MWSIILFLSNCQRLDHSFAGRDGASLAGPRIELGAEREGLLKVLDEDAHFGGEPTAGRPERMDRHSSFEGCQKTYSGAFSQFGGEQPGWGLGYPEMFQDTHPHLFYIAGSEDAGGDDTLGTKYPRLHRPSLDKHHGPVTIEIVWRLRRAVPCEVLGCRHENNHRLSEFSSDQIRVRKIAGVDRQIEAVFDYCGRAFRRGHLDGVWSENSIGLFAVSYR
jgi:hypothetical protein